MKINKQAQNINNMSHIERIEYFASAGRVTAKQILQLLDGEIVSFWAGIIRGIFATDENGNYRFDNKESALNAAREFRQRCKDSLDDYDEPMDDATRYVFGAM